MRAAALSGGRGGGEPNSRAFQQLLVLQLPLARSYSVRSLHSYRAALGRALLLRHDG